MNYCHNTHKSETRRQLLEMAQEDQSDASQQTAASDEDKRTVNQASPCVIEIHDSTTECEEEQTPSLVLMEEKAFVTSLHSFMKAKGTPIERIPHLGFKQINLWKIYKAVEKLGGYDSKLEWAKQLKQLRNRRTGIKGGGAGTQQMLKKALTNMSVRVKQVTARRYWKKVYDELGGSPGSTSAATCTRRHYERLVLPFERHIKGEEDKPLPPSKPRKPYKRNVDGKVNKAEVKTKRTQSDRELDSEILAQRSPEAACQGEAVLHPHSSLWPSTPDRTHPDCSHPNRAPTDHCSSVYAHILPVPTSSSWTSHIPPSAAGEVISPLEKKKRMAQASLNLPLSPQSEDKERPSVIHCPHSPARASSSRNCNSSDDSPLPLSSSSSRSSSFSSISSEDGPEGSDDKPTSELPHNCASTAKNTRSSSDDSKPVSCGQTSKDPTGQNKDVSHIGSQSLTTDSIKSQIKDSAWNLSHKARSKYLTHPTHVSPSFTEKPNWAPTSTSSFTKVIPKSVQLLRPAPIRPAYKAYQSRAVQQDDAPPSAKELNNVVSLFYQTDKRDKSRTMLQKVPPTQQSLPHGTTTTTTTLPVSCVLSSYDKSGRDSRHHPPLHPAFLPSRMRLPQSQFMYRHVPLGPAHPALIGPAVYPYPYHIPLLNPQTGYTCTLPALYSHKM